jgi:hypothetical protein
MKRKANKMKRFCQETSVRAQYVMSVGWMVPLIDRSLRAPLCVRYNAEVVACGVIHLAARRLGVS